MGVMINNPSNVRVEGLSIRGFGLAVTAPPPEIGILVLQSRGVVLSRNSIFNVGLGIFVPGRRTFGNRIEDNTLIAMSNGVFDICYNPAADDPGTPKGDLVEENLIRGLLTAAQISGRADYNVIDGNTLIYRVAALESPNASNIFMNNPLRFHHHWLLVPNAQLLHPPRLHVVHIARRKHKVGLLPRFMQTRRVVNGDLPFAHHLETIACDDDRSGF